MTKLLTALFAGLFAIGATAPVFAADKKDEKKAEAKKADVKKDDKKAEAKKDDKKAADKK